MPVPHPPPWLHAPDVDHNICGKRKPDGADAAVAELASRQHGVVARWELLALGLSPRVIDHRLAQGRLHALHRGVYAVGHRALTREARWMAAVLAGGPEAVLSGRAAAALWGILASAGGTITVTVPRQRRPRAGVTWRVGRLPDDEVTRTDGIPVTTVPRTLFDLAARLRPRELEHALNQAEVLRLWDELSLDRLLRRYPRHHGSRTVRTVLAARRAGARFTRSDLEVHFLELVDEAGLQVPETNAIVEGLEVDCVWNDARVAVELDSRTYHATRAAFERDRERDRVLQAAGWHPIRVTSRQLVLSRDRLKADLRTLLHQT
jgi:very-short-patch-repair endonuclease/predicted transcriptional regulator of viral defense system